MAIKKYLFVLFMLSLLVDFCQEIKTKTNKHKTKQNEFILYINERENLNENTKIYKYFNEEIVAFILILICQLANV